MKSLKEMDARRSERAERKRLPLDHLTEDKTDEFSLNSIATKLYELIHFFKVHKDSISQVFLEKHAEDHRLGYFLSCM